MATTGLRTVGRNWSSAANDHPADQELRIVTIPNPPYIWLHSMPDGSVTYEGYLFDLWKILAQSLNLRYRMVPLLKGTFGRLDENGTWTGMVGELAYGRADVALSWLHVRRDRLEVIEYLDGAVVDENFETFYISKAPEDALSPTWHGVSSLLKPLHVTVWWMLLGTLLLLSLSLRLALRRSGADDRQVTSELTWTACVLTVFRSLVGQGWPLVPSSLSGRIVTLCTWILCIIVVNSYTANLISYLTVVVEDRPISSLKEFSERSDWQLMLDPGHTVVSDWMLSKDPYERALYRHVMRRDRLLAYDRTRETAHLSLEPRTLGYFDINEMFRYLGNKTCSLTALFNHPLKGTKNYIAIAKGFGDLRKAMNQVLQRMNEAGVMSRLRKKWVREDDTCVRPREAAPVSLGNSVTLLLITPVSGAFSILVLLVEMLCFGSSVSKVCSKTSGSNDSSVETLTDNGQAATSKDSATRQDKHKRSHFVVFTAK